MTSSIIGGFIRFCMYERIVLRNNRDNKIIGGEILSKEGKLTMLDFVIDNQFQLNHYISYLFYQITKNNFQKESCHNCLGDTSFF